MTSSLLIPIYALPPFGLHLRRKLATESRSAVTVVASDADLVFPVAARTNYAFWLQAFFEGPTTGQFKFRLDVPSSPTLFRNRIQYVVPGATNNTNAVQTAAANINIASFSAATGGVMAMNGVLHNGANAGLLAFQWAQNTSDAGATVVLAGSFLQVVQMA